MDNTNSFNNECIFCLELLNNCYNNKHNSKHNSKHNDKNYKNILLDITNTNIKLKCNHLFHLECFFLYIKYNSTTLNDLNCPLCRYNILKNDIRKILILYFILLIKLRLKISIDNLFHFLKNVVKLQSIKTSDHTSDHTSDYTNDDASDDSVFLKTKIYLRLRQILKIILI